MLQLKEITKQYRVGDKVVDALNGITADFGEKELVAVLGSSGCGKTTLMNIIGGLDRFTSGDLIINGKSTKNYKEKDWNNYRNHQIGFVFQSYNLIPHTTVFGNVELALTLSGVTAKERKKRVLDALEKVGLGDQIYKKPNQMSGGQMQRVAIARAIVNNPKILLADEPTGAVDSKTGIQIMEILKEISKTCLVILVTHNQELACHYADRIIKMQDGLILSEEKNVCNRENEAAVTDSGSQSAADQTAPAVKKKMKKAKMGFATATKLSLGNLLNKKGRSVITIISGAISVICIALILAMNSGFSYYIYDYERNNLSRYPIKITTQTTSLTDLLTEAFSQGENFDRSKVNFDSMLELFKDDVEMREKYTDTELIYLSKLIMAVIETGISGFQNLEDFEFESELDVLSEIFGVSMGTDIIEFMRALETGFHPEWGAVMRNYGLDFSIYKKDDAGKEHRLNPVDMFISFLEDSGFMDLLKLYPGGLGGRINSLLYGEEMKEMQQMFENSDPWSMMIDDSNLLELQYDVLAGRLPQFGTDHAKNEIVLVVDEYNQLDDFTLFLLGAISVESFALSVINQFRPLLPENANGLLDMLIRMLFPPDTEEIKTEYDFNEFIGGNGAEPSTFVLRIPTDYYSMNEETGVYNKMGEGVEVKVVGILRLKPGLNAGVISGAIGYTEALATSLIDKGNNAPVVQALDSALEKYNTDRETLLKTAQRIMDSGLDMSSFSQISEPQRVAVFEEILALAGSLDLTEEQIALLLDIASKMEGFEFTPENKIIADELLSLFTALDISEENYTIILEAAALLETMGPNEDNLDALMRAAKLLMQLNPSEQNLDALTRAATLLGGLELSEQEIAVLVEAAGLLGQINPQSESISDLIQIATLLRGVAITPERINGIAAIIEVLSGLDVEPDSQTLQEIFETAGLLSVTPDDLALWGQMAILMNELTAPNQAIISEALPMLFDLGLTSDEISNIWEAARIAIELDLESEDIQLIVRAAEVLSAIELSESDIEILAETLGVLSEIEISEGDAQILTQVLSVLAEINVSDSDAEILVQVAKTLLQLDVTEDDLDTLIRIAELMTMLNMGSQDMLTLRNVADLALRLNLSEADMDILWEMISLTVTLELTSADIENAKTAIALTEQIHLTEEENAALQELISLVSSFDMSDTAAVDDLIDLIRAISLTEEEQTAAMEALTLAMSVAGYRPEDIETVTGMIQSIISLNLTEDEIDLIINLLPELAKIDFSKNDAEVMKQLGSIFQIRNVTVSESAACKHGPNAKHTAECAWYDVAQVDALMATFLLKDKMRPDSIDIYSYSIESRNEVLDFINKFNAGVTEDEELSGSSIDYTVVYTDELSEITASMSSMINTITYILIGVAAIAVIVAMLLVAIILYISVQDRIKEIGLLRSLGASKGNVSSVFIAETFIIGLVSGVVGVGIALLLTLPANMIIKSVLGISDLLKPVWWHQFALIGLAFVITVISGLIPAASAAKKDPVLALRSE